jgi:hypothetical protein
MLALSISTPATGTAGSVELLAAIAGCCLWVWMSGTSVGLPDVEIEVQHLPERPRPRGFGMALLPCAMAEPLLQVGVPGGAFSESHGATQSLPNLVWASRPHHPQPICYRTCRQGA